MHQPSLCYKYEFEFFFCIHWIITIYSGTFMLKDFLFLLKQKCRHYAILPITKDILSGKGFSNFLFLLGTLAFIRACMLLAPEPLLISVSSLVNGRELPIYCVETEQKKVALSFDAAWGNEDTPAILEILKKHNVHVTFFMTGEWVENYPEDVNAIYAAGHDLGY